ncbi:MAG: CHRD domain-containing protein [Thermoleophilaceae bacterium]
MRQRRVQLAAVVAIVSIVSVVATAAVAGNGQDVKAKLDGFQEVPSISTDGNGKFKAKILSNEIQYRLKYRDLEGGAVAAAHIHFAERHVNGGIVAFLCGGGGKPACPPAPATVTGTIVPTDVLAVPAQGFAAGEFDELVRAIRAGATYANVHTATFGNGEIRGQINGGKNDD